MLNDFVEKKRNKTNVFQLCCGQRAYVGYVGLVGRTLKIVKMVAGLPINEQIYMIKNFLEPIN
jgi:hypothetical protein